MREEEKGVKELTEKDCEQIARIFTPYLQNGTVELRRTKDGIIVYHVRRKEIKRFNA